MFFSFLTTFIVYSMENLLENYWCSRTILCERKRTDLILLIYTFNDEKTLYLTVNLAFQFL